MAAMLLALVLQACSTLPTAPAPAEPALQTCLRWFAQLEEQLAQHGVRDAQSARLEGFPHLRVERFEAALRQRAAEDEAAFQAWLARLAALGASAQVLELQRLPAAGLQVLGMTRQQALAHAAVCRHGLLQADAQPGPRRQALLARAFVPDAYEALARVAGLYPLTRWPFHWGVQGWQQQTQAAFDAVAAGQGPAFAPQRYRPAALPGAPGPPVPLPALTSAPRDALGVPQPGPALLQQLLQAHAPVLEVEQAGDFDKLGRALPLPAGGWALDTTQPTLYARVAHTLVQGRPALQLVYLAWFSERPPRRRLDLLAGRWDGLIWRVTLDAEGQPLLYDSIHACGCYHLFFPGPALRPRPAPAPGIEWLFAPAAAPQVQPEQRIVLRLASGSHYLLGVRAEAPGDGIDYQLREEDELRGLPPPEPDEPEPVLRSLYGADGLLAGSQRAERWFFWPMGVRSAGAQRQWGHHATAFVGRRHFDDADLIDLRFEMLESLGP